MGKVYHLHKWVPYRSYSPSSTHRKAYNHALLRATLRDNRNRIDLTGFGIVPIVHGQTRRLIFCGKTERENPLSSKGFPYQNEVLSLWTGLARNVKNGDQDQDKQRQAINFWIEGNKASPYLGYGVDSISARSSEIREKLRGWCPTLFFTGDQVRQVASLGNLVL